MPSYDDMSFLAGWQDNLADATEYLTTASEDYRPIISVASTMVESVCSFKNDLDRIKYDGDGIDSAFGDILEWTEDISASIGKSSDEGLNAELSAMTDLFAMSIEVVNEMITRVSSLESKEDQKAVLKAINSGQTLDSLFDSTDLRDKLLEGIDTSTLEVADDASGFDVIFADIWKDDKEVLNIALEGVDGVSADSLASAILTGTIVTTSVWKKIGISGTKTALLKGLDKIENIGEAAAASGMPMNIAQRVASRLAANKVPIKVGGLVISYAANVAVEVLANNRDLKDFDVWVDAGSKLAITEVAKIATTYLITSVAGEAFVAGMTGGIVVAAASFVVGLIGTTLYDKWKKWYYSNGDGISSKYDSYTNKQLEDALEDMGYDFGAPKCGDYSIYDVAAAMKTEDFPDEVIDFIMAGAGVDIDNKERFFTYDSSGNKVITPRAQAIMDVLRTCDGLNYPQYYTGVDEEYKKEYNETLDQLKEMGLDAGTYSRVLSMDRDVRDMIIAGATDGVFYTERAWDDKDVE